MEPTAARLSTVGQGTRWTFFAYAYAGLIGLGVCYFILRIPLQVTDCLLLLIDSLNASSVWEQALRHSDRGGYFRPLYWGQVKVLFDLAQGHYHLAFKGFQSAQLLMLCWLFARYAQVRTMLDFAAFSLAVTILFGLHTLLGQVWEAYPTNHFLEISLACMLALHLSTTRPGRHLSDMLAVVTFAAALFTLESGVVVWVCLVSAYLAGARGVSRNGLLVATVILLGYFYVRFGYLGLGLPALHERSSGFGFSRLDPGQLNREFASGATWFYAYNVVASVLTVLFSEPRAGEWMFTRALVRGGMEPWMIINLVSSGLSSAAILWYFAQALSGKAADDTREHTVRVAAPAAILGNAVVSYAYTKDVIMAPAGLAYAILSFFAVRTVLGRLGEAGWRYRAASMAVLVLLVVGSATWSARTVGTFYKMRQAAYEQRNEWAEVDQWLLKQGVALKSPAETHLMETLRRAAVTSRAPNPYFAQPRARLWVDQGQR